MSKAKRVKVEFVGGPNCGHRDELGVQSDGKPPIIIKPARHNGGVYRRADIYRGYRFYRWEPPSKNASEGETAGAT